MIVSSRIFLLLGLIVSILSPQTGWTQDSHKEIEQTAQLLTTFLNAGRHHRRAQPIIDQRFRESRQGIHP